MPDDSATPPHLIIMAGPNGAGKSTSAAVLLPSDMPFVNADEIAKEFGENDPDSTQIRAGREMIRRLDTLEAAGQSFAIETTLASRSFVPRILRLREKGYEISLFFLWLPSADLAVARVAGAVDTIFPNRSSAVAMSVACITSFASISHWPITGHFLTTPPCENQRRSQKEKPK